MKFLFSKGTEGKVLIRIEKELGLETFLDFRASDLIVKAWGTPPSYG
jgi:hypothetical protein